MITFGCNTWIFKSQEANILTIFLWHAMEDKGYWIDEVPLFLPYPRSWRVLFGEFLNFLHISLDSFNRYRMCTYGVSGDLNLFGTGPALTSLTVCIQMEVTQGKLLWFSHTNNIFTCLWYVIVRCTLFIRYKACMRVC